jgi:rubrerythrin
MDFQQSRTYQNLLQAYENELLSTTKYLIYQDITRNEGYIEISNIYETVARNNKEHARIWLRTINQGTLPDTTTVLQESIQIESENASNMYQEFAAIAVEEGYPEIASLFSGVANIDYNHEFQFRTIYENVVNNQVFCKPETTLWICIQCGNVMSGECAPVICPVCKFPQGFYKLYE